MAAAEPPTSSLLLVAGAGRSGTSTVTGSLARLGFAVPQPEVPADETNPRGFYEPQWVVDFHKRVLADVKVRPNDARPDAVGRAAEAAARPELVAELSTWLSRWRDEASLVVKDPRTFWFEGLWRAAARDAGRELAFLTMLRHPAAVARSRDTHYLAGVDAERRRSRETTNVASWCHGTLVTERATRGDRRAFVLYPELMGSWRDALGRAGEQLGFHTLLADDEAAAAVDDFIDADLNRSQVDWTQLSVHREVRDLAEEIWRAADGLVRRPGDEDLCSTFDHLHAEYDRLYAMASDLTLDQFGVEREEHRAARRRVRQDAGRLREENRRLRDRVEQLESSRAVRLARRLGRH